MKRVMQTRFELGNGDCLHACLASILEIDIDDIPNLSAESKCLGDQIANEDAFLASRGLRAIRCHMTGGYEAGDVFFVFDGYGIAWGKSPRSRVQHCVVVKHDDGALLVAHDPHPDGNGIEGEFSGVAWIVPASTQAVPRAVADRLAKALEMCAANDKTEYDYSGKARLNRNGAAPDHPGERFKTPREIAADAIAEYRKAVNP